MASSSSSAAEKPLYDPRKAPTTMTQLTQGALEKIKERQAARMNPLLETLKAGLLLDMQFAADDAFELIAEERELVITKELRDKLMPVVEAALKEELLGSVKKELRRTLTPIVGAEIRKEALENAGFQGSLKDFDKTLEVYKERKFKAADKEVESHESARKNLIDMDVKQLLENKRTEITQQTINATNAMFEDLAEKEKQKLQEMNERLSLIETSEMQKIDEGLELRWNQGIGNVSAEIAKERQRRMNELDDYFNENQATRLQKIIEEVATARETNFAELEQDLKDEKEQKLASQDLQITNLRNKKLAELTREIESERAKERSKFSKEKVSESTPRRPDDVGTNEESNEGPTTTIQSPKPAKSVNAQDVETKKNDATAKNGKNKRIAEESDEDATSNKRLRYDGSGNLAGPPAEKASAVDPATAPITAPDARPTQGKKKGVKSGRVGKKFGKKPVSTASRKRLRSGRSYSPLV